MNRLQGKTAVITGGTEGIGEAAVRRFLQEGARVMIAARNEEKGNQLVRELGPNCRFCRLDVADYGSWETCLDQVMKDFGRLDILVNNAGISVVETIADATPESYDRIIAVNQKGVFYGMKKAIELMGKGPVCMGKEPGTCAIVNTASIDGVVGDPIYFAYCASKAAVEAMTRCAALYCGGEGLPIRVNAVAPGYIMTPMAAQDAAEKNMTLQEYEQAMAGDHPIGHLGRPEDIASAYLYLASEEAAFVTGTTLLVDGGYTAR